MIHIWHISTTISADRRRSYGCALLQYTSIYTIDSLVTFLHFSMRKPLHDEQILRILIYIV